MLPQENQKRLREIWSERREIQIAIVPKPVREAVHRLKSEMGTAINNT
jgi:hypothetical protein